MIIRKDRFQAITALMVDRSGDQPSDDAEPARRAERSFSPMSRSKKKRQTVLLQGRVIGTGGRRTTALRGRPGVYTLEK